MAGGVRCTRKLKQWMVQQVDSEKYPGLVWEDRKLGMFRIPWKHAGKQDYRHDEDAAIFKAWAQFKGKFKDGDKVDPATWKTRLRCALNKSSEFEEVPKRSQLDISEPYKVYKIIDDTTMKKRIPLAVPLSSVKMEGSGNVAMETSRSSSPLCNPVGAMEEQVKSNAPSIESQLMDSDSCSDPSSGSDMSAQEEGSGEAISLDCILTPVTEVPPDYMINITSSITPSLPDKGPNSMCVSFYYGGVQVSSQVTRHGCRISSSAPSPRGDDAFGPQALEKLCFPPTDGVAQPEKLQATKELLTFLERGVMLDSNANGIFASRLCQGRVFWTGPCAPRPDRPNKLERDRVEKLFDRQKFNQDLQQYQALGTTALPQYQVTLCFGEELTETDSLADKLITVQIYQVATRQLIDRELELQTTSVILSQLTSENFSDRVTFTLREASGSLYGIS